jgi:hypothetical protein
MNGNIDNLREGLWPHFSEIAATFDRANKLILDVEHLGESELRERLTRMKEGGGQPDACAIEIQERFERWNQLDRNEPPEQIAKWKDGRHTGQLHSRADRCEGCAVIASEIVLLAVDQLERAIVQALLSRNEAVSVQVQHIESDQPPSSPKPRDP